MNDKYMPYYDAGLLFGAPMRNAIAWCDTNANLFEHWLEWQRACWQPMFDAQAAWLRWWQDQAGAVVLRGTEQLA